MRGYTARWLVEEFHKTWKSGLCMVEDTQLRSAEAIDKWATLLATVAGRCHFGYGEFAGIGSGLLG